MSGVPRVETACLPSEAANDLFGRAMEAITESHANRRMQQVCDAVKSGASFKDAINQHCPSLRAAREEGEQAGEKFRGEIQKIFADAIQPEPEAMPMAPETMQAIDALEMCMAQMKPCHAHHNGYRLHKMYVRELFMPAGFRCSSKVHRYSHPFFIMEGIVDVWHETEGWQRFVGPHFGITLAGTRRILAVQTNCRWITCHAVEGETEEEIENEIIIPNPPSLFAAALQKANAEHVTKEELS